MFNQPVILAAIISLLFSGGSASGCRTKQSAKSQVNTPPMPQTETGKSGIGELKALAEGFHSSITSPFVAVIRGEETYSSLMKLEPTLPKLGGDFFKSNVVIAAFLGQRNTGG